MDSIIVGETYIEPMTPPTTHPRGSSQQAVPSTKRRRYSQTPKASSRAARFNVEDDRNASPGSNEIRIFPLRAILDDRVKRRIRRNGLSEEMNIIFDERRQRVKKTAEEMQHLRDQLATKEAENEELREQSSVLQDTSRIQELEEEIADLRQGIVNGEPTIVEEQSPHYDDWDMGAADGFTDHDSVTETDDHFGDDTTIEVESSTTPIMTKAYVGSAFTPPNTSPTKPGTPEFPCHLVPTPNCDAGVQACLDDTNKMMLESELKGLRCELASLNRALDDQKQVESDLATRLASSKSFEVDPDLQLQMDIMVQTLADKTAVLADLDASLSSLGPPGVNPNHIVSTLKDAFQSARKELEEILGEEGPLPLSCHGAGVLDVALRRLRGVARKVKEQEGALAGYRTLEDSLRQQLDDRAEVMEEMGRKLREKDDRIFKLEDDVDRLQVAVEDYRGSLAEFETLVQQMEAASREAKAKLSTEMENGAKSVAQRDAQLAGMEAKLGSMISATADLRTQLAQAHVDSEVGMAVVEAAHECEIALRDARVVELQGEVTSLKEALCQAHAAISQLRTEKRRLQGDADRENKAARDTVACLRTQLLQTLQMSEAFLAPPAPTHEPHNMDADGMEEEGY